jgi:hypothetical protein
MDMKDKAIKNDKTDPLVDLSSCPCSVKCLYT